MTKLLDPKILAPLLGVITYAVSMVVLTQGILQDVVKAPVKVVQAKEVVPEKLIEPKPDYETEYTPSYQEPSYSGKSWEFFNPEISQLQEELRNEKKRLYEQSQHLDLVEKRVLDEKKNLTRLRDQIERLKTEFNNFLLTSRGQQADNLRRTADVMRTMKTDDAVALIMTMNLPETTRLMGFFRPEEAAVYLEKMTSMGPRGLELAAEISSGLRRVYIPDMIIPEEEKVEINLDKAESNRIAGLAEFYTSLGARESYALLKDSNDELVVKTLLHMLPDMQKGILGLMIAEGNVGEKRAQKISRILHESNHDSGIQKSIDDAVYYISEAESKKLQRNMDLYALMDDQELLDYLKENFSLLEVAKLFKHLDPDRKDMLMLTIIKEDTFGARRGKELAELLNRMELGTPNNNIQVGEAQVVDPPANE